MAKHETPAPTPRPRSSIEADKDRRTQQGQGGDTTRELPGGVDPRAPQYPGPMSTSENVTTEEQEAAQAALKEGDVTTAPTQYGSSATRAEQIESQVAAGENPLSPQSTSFNEPHDVSGGLTTPPRPEGQKDPVPRGRAHLFDPRTGAPQMGAQRRARLEDDDDDSEVEVELAHPITLTDDHGTAHTYQAGKQKVPKQHSEHWYLKQHLVPKQAKKAAKEDEPTPRKKAE